MKEDTINSLDSFVSDLLKEVVPRNIVIICSSKIDDLLLHILSKYLLQKIAKSNDQDELLEGDRPLSTFSAKIKLSYRLSIIDEQLYSILEKVRNIRNRSAHEIVFDISKSPLKDNIVDLKKAVCQRKSFELTQKRFFYDLNMNTDYNELKCIFLTVCILLEAICDIIERIKINNKIYKLSKR